MDADEIIEFLESRIQENGRKERLKKLGLSLLFMDKMSEHVVDLAVEKMRKFLAEYNESHERLKDELRKKLVELLEECVQLCKAEEVVEKAYP